MWSCGNHKLEQMFYTRREYKESDHRPVVAYFIVEVKRVDKVKRDQIKAQIQQVYIFPLHFYIEQYDRMAELSQ